MTKLLSCRINDELKDEYADFIEEKYGYKRNRYGSELSKWIKLGLTLEGYGNYSNDPDVVQLLDGFRLKEQCTHTQNQDSNKDTNEVDELKQEIKEMKKSMDEMKVQLVKAVSQEPKKERDHYQRMDSFVSQFKEEYGCDQQVSVGDIGKLVMRTHGVCDPRSIQNRVEYLVASGCIEQYAPNVYNIKP